MVKLTVGSLFSGIGGLELGLERVGYFRTLWFSEIDPYASAVLKKHWPEVPNLGDITKVDWYGVEKPDMLVGGFPCQDISIAGKGKGIREGERSGLWREYAKAIRVLRPRYVLAENVPEVANRGLDVVLADLAEMGYDAEWGLLSASAVGALHKRKRFFLFAYPNGERHIHGEPEIQPAKAGKPPFGESQSGVSIADAYNDCGSDRQTQTRGDSIERLFRIPDRASGFHQFQGIETIQDLKRRKGIPEPLIRRNVNGIPNRMDRIKCLGNAVVPQVAETIGRWIKEVDQLEL